MIHDTVVSARWSVTWFTLLAAGHCYAANTRKAGHLGMKKRKTDNEDGSSRFRASSRIFSANDEWYFSTREGDHGPFESETTAQKELNRFISEIDPPEPEYIEITVERPKNDPKVWDQYDLLN